MTIPVFVPKLPTAEDLLPYLREIELARTYSNFSHNLTSEKTKQRACKI